MKKLSVMLLAFSLLLTMAACGEPEREDVESIPNITLTDADEETTLPSEEETTLAEETGLRTETFVIPDTADECEGSIEIASRSCNQVALNFVAAIAQNYYTSAVNGFDIDESPYITAEDVAYAVPRSTYRGIADYAGKEVYLYVDEDETVSYDDTATVTVQLRTGEDAILNSYSVRLKLNMDNKWTVEDSDFYETDYYISVSGNTTLYIGDAEVSKDLFDHKTGYAERMDCYKIPVIGKSVKTLRIVCDAFEEQAEAVPQSNNSEEPFRIDHELSETELNDALNATKNLWQALYNDYVNGVPEAEWLKYFASDAPSTYVNDIKTAFDNLTKGSSGYPDVDHHITIIQKRSDAKCYYQTDKVIAMNVQYQLDWVWQFSLGGPENCRRFSHIMLTIEDGEYKIFEVSDMAFFNGNSGSDW